MMDDERDVVLFLVGAVSFATHLMMAAEFAVIRVEDHDRVPVHLVVFERSQHMHDLLVAVADAIVIIVAEDMPAAIPLRPLAPHHVLDRLIDRMRYRAARRVQRLAAAHRQRQVAPSPLIEIVFGRWKDWNGWILSLNDLTRQIRI